MKEESKLTPFFGEFLGTMILIIFGAGVVAGVTLKGTKAEGAGWIVISIAWGLAVTMAIYTVGPISDAHINPAVTVGFALVGDFPWSSVPAYITAQLLGAFTGAAAVWLHYYPHFAKTEDTAAKLGVFATGPAVRHRPSNLFSEVLGTFLLVFVMLAMGSQAFAEGVNPIIVGTLIMVIGLSLGSTTGYAINPARDLGPRLAHAFLPISGKGDSDWSYAWIPVVGPLLGGSLGALSYQAWFEGTTTPALWMAVTLFILAVIFAVVLEQQSASKKPVDYEVIHTKS
ncbi:MIP/aquaporin family protein [Salsuginibacillus halophilus]|uniref:MIP/aquaporin family protein n=1 Tax=Salsuginibacillus halophilus TaxID=517424 RepID=UPI003CFC3A84